MKDRKLYFTCYITEAFEPYWERFNDLFVPEVQKIYEKQMALKEKNLKDNKAHNNRDYKHYKKDFVSMALRRLIKKAVDLKTKQMLQEADKNEQSQ